MDIKWKKFQISSFITFCKMILHTVQQLHNHQVQYAKYILYGR